MYRIKVNGKINIKYFIDNLQFIKYNVVKKATALSSGRMIASFSFFSKKFLAQGFGRWRRIEII